MLKTTMDLDGSSLVASLIVSSIGFVAFMYGRKQERVPQIAAGLLLMVFPYFIPNALLMLAIGALICLALFVAVRAGY